MLLGVDESAVEATAASLIVIDVITDRPVYYPALLDRMLSRNKKQSARVSALETLRRRLSLDESSSGACVVRDVLPADRESVSRLCVCVCVCVCDPAECDSGFAFGIPLLLKCLGVSRVGGPLT